MAGASGGDRRSRRGVGEACLMSGVDEYMKRAEECERLAGACIAESNREILLFTAMHWRAMAEDIRASACGLAPGETGRDPIALC
jgi:hypothetical protein